MKEISREGENPKPSGSFLVSNKFFSGLSSNKISITFYYWIKV